MTRVQVASILVGCAILPTFGCTDAPESHRDSIPRPDLSLVSESRLLESIEAAQAVVANSPRSASAWGQLGHVYQVHGWRAEAAYCYRRASQLEPSEFRWLYYLGRSMETTDPASAAEVLGHAISLNASYPPAHIAYARVLRFLGRVEEARKQLDRAAELDPKNPYAELGLGELALSAGDFESAHDHLRRALALHPEQSEAHQSLAQVELALGDMEAAVRHAQAARKRTQFVQMHDILQQEVERAGVTKYWLGIRGYRSLLAGDFERAVAELGEALLRDERSPIPWYNYGLALFGARRYEQAVLSFERALTAAEDDNDKDTIEPAILLQMYTYSGLAYAKVGDAESAEKNLRKALALDQASAEAIINLATLSAEKNLRKALALNQASPEAIINLATLFYARGRLGDAIALLQGAPGVDRDPRTARLLDRLLQERAPSSGERDR